MKDRGYSIKFCSFSSGSSGNCYLVKTEETAILVDAGITGKQFIRGLEKTETLPEEISAILITHEHHDHIRGLATIHNKIKSASVYTSEGTIAALAEKLGSKIYDINFHPLRSSAKTSDRKFNIGDIEVGSFALSHDAAEPLGFSFRKGKSKLAIVTDTGMMTEEIFREISDADLIALEANYEENILRMNRKYPYELKSRINSDRGHLSNAAAANIIARILTENSEKKSGITPEFLLSHLSQSNNTPSNADITVSNLVKTLGFIKDRDYKLAVLMRDEISRIYAI